LSEDFPESVDLIQGGLGNMPAYSQVLNRHDSRRILVWLATLDPETGQGPGGDPEEEDAEGDPAPVEEADEVSQEAAVGPEKAQ
jgi:hypothetical protein